MHAFDLAKIGGATIVVRASGAAEKIVTLDGEQRALSEGMLLICDAAEPVAIAGVMGGRDSEVGSDTVDILLECASFEPKSIRRTRKDLGMSTDASYRFERGVDPDSMERAMLRAVELVVATAGGTTDPIGLAAGPGFAERAPVELRMSRIARVLGVEFDLTTVRSLLEPIGFGVRGSDKDDDRCSVEVPGHRRLDVTREIDLIEEIARRWGYDRFPSNLSPFRPSSVPDDPLLAVQDRVRDHLSQRGLLEVQTPAFAPADEGDVAVLNPVSSEEGMLRRALLPGVIRRVQHNFARGHRNVRFFETGTAFGPGEGLPTEETRVAAILTGARERPHWDVDGVDVDLWTMKALFMEVAALWSEGRPEVVPAGADDSVPPFDRDSMLELRGPDGEVMGRVGRIEPSGLDVPPWAGALWGLEIAIPSEPQPVAPHQFVAPPQHPGTSRDLALLVPEAVSSTQVMEILRAEAGELFESAEVFDRYLGVGIPEGTSSVGFRVRFSGRDRTLSDAEVDGPVEVMVRRLREELDVKVRGA